MRKLFVMCLLLGNYMGISQTKTALLFQSGNYELNPKAAERNLKAVDGEVYFGKYVRLFQFNETPNKNTQAALEGMGIKVLGYIPKNTYMVALPFGFKQDLSKLDLRAISPMLAPMKLSKNLAASNYPDWAVQGNNITLSIRFFPYFSQSETNVLLQQLSEKYDTEFVRIHEDEIEATVPFNVINELTALPFVMFIQSMEDPGEIENYRARISHRVDAVGLNSANPYKLDGSGVHVSLGDYDYGVAGPHIDFSGRLNDKITGADNGTNHGIHTMGTVFGAGNLDPDGTGMAPGAELTYYTYPQNLFFVDNDYANDNVRITSSSFSNNCNTYTNFSSRVDKDMYDNPKLVHVFSAGNNNFNNCGYGAGNQWGNITGGHKQGKNVIAVANLTTLDDIANSSSRGPAHDGRVKPDIGGVGTSVYSTEEDNTYGQKTGTSMSCPGIAGSLAVLYQGFKEFNNGQEPDGGLAKAILLNTADDVGNKHVDFIYGYGRVNVLRAMECIEDNNIVVDTISGNGSNTFSINVPAGIKEMRVMLHWTDPEAFSGSSRALVNDLDLSVKHDNSNITYQPWVLNPTPNSALINSVAVRAKDSLNTSEQFTLENPDTGAYTITVSGAGIPMGTQKYYVIYTFVEDNLKLVAPFGGEVLNPLENYVIRFEGVDLTSTSQIDYTTNGGTTWSTITSGLNSQTQNFNWNIPNNVVSTKAKVRVINGSDTSISKTFSILRSPGGLQVDWVCLDSLQISWNTVSGAVGYVVHQLGNVYMDSVGTTTQTSFVLKGISNVNSEWISVTALDSNNQKSVRARAIETPIGLLNCVVPYDVEPKQIMHPLGLYTDCLDATSVTPTVMIFNKGTQPIDNISVNLELGSTSLNTVYTSTVQPGDSVYVTFSGTISLSAGANNITAWVEHPDDPLWWNDTISSRALLSAGTTQNLPYFQNFDNFQACSDASTCGEVNCSLSEGWYNEMNGFSDNHDFRTYSGATPTSNTGPSQDHTSGNGNYLYLEASTCYFSDALLKSPCFNVVGNNQEMTFWYHMLGTEMGRLHVDVLYDGQIDLDVMQMLRGNKGNVWRQQRVDLSKYSGKDIVIQFRAQTGLWHRSDLAIDDIAIGDQGIGIDELSLNRIELMPNPASETIHLKWKDADQKNAEIRILNNMGQVVYAGEWQNLVEWQHDISSWSNGLYFIHIYYEENHEYLKLIKQ